MNVVVDGTPLLFRRAGIGRYAFELLWRFSRAAPPAAVRVANLGVSLARTRLRPGTDPVRLGETIAASRLGGLAFFFLPRRIRDALVAAQAERVRTDVYFAPNFLGVYGRSFKTVITVHDLGSHFYPEHTQPAMLRALRSQLADNIRRADGIVTDAECTRRDIVAVFGADPARVAVVPLAASASFRPVADPAVLQAVRRRYALPDRFVLFVGTLEPRKNLARLFDAFARLAAAPGFAHKLVLVGARGWKSEDITARLADLSARGLARHLGYVRDGDLAAIYSLADLFVFPSAYEGFGIPPLEAMSCGVPVVSSSASSLPEVCGDAAVYFDPGSEDELAAAMRRVISNPALAAELREKGFRQAERFSWDKTAELLWKYFGAVRAGSR
jgi:glycosyltransferase involved in cell wall biosynthesis